MKLKYSVMHSDAYKKRKASRMKAVKDYRTNRTIMSSREYLVAANSINGQRRIESRQRINKILSQKTEE